MTKKHKCPRCFGTIWRRVYVGDWVIVNRKRVFVEDVGGNLFKCFECGHPRWED